MLKQTSLGHLKCCTLWALDEKIISISAVVGHRVIFLNQSKGQNVNYSLGVIPHRIRISGEVTNFFGLCHSCVTMDTYILSIGVISDILDVFLLMSTLHVD